MLYKAHRFTDSLGAQATIAPILKSLTYAGDSWRRRDIREGEEVASAWDELIAVDNPHLEWRTPCGHVSKEMPKHLVYTEANALEDQVLFPNDSGRGRFKAIDNHMTEFESGRMEKVSPPKRGIVKLKEPLADSIFGRTPVYHEALHRRYRRI